MKGIVSELTNYKFGPTFNTASFWITSDGSADAEAKFEAYSCYYFGGSTSKWYEGISTQIEVGQEVVIFGKVTFYASNSIYETVSKAAQIYSINGVTADPASIQASNVSNVAAAGVTDATLSVTLLNAEGYNVEVVGDGTVVTSASYVDNAVKYTVAANTSTEAKQGTITITLTKAGAEDVVKVVTVSQVAAGTVVTEDPYAMGDNVSWTLGTNAYLESTTVKSVRRGVFTQYPWNIEDIANSNGGILSIPKSHVYGQVAGGDVWITFTGGTNIEAQTEANKIYLSAYGNNAFIQTGHSNGTASIHEQKIIANIIFYMIAKQYVEEEEVE